MQDHSVDIIQTDATGEVYMWVELTLEIEQPVLYWKDIKYLKLAANMAMGRIDRHGGSGGVKLHVRSGPNVGDDVILAAKNVCMDMIEFNCHNPFYFNTNTTCKEYVNIVISKIVEVEKGGDREQVKKDLHAVQQAFHQLEEKYPIVLQSHIPKESIRAITRWLEEQFAKEYAIAPPPTSIEDREAASFPSYE